MEGPGGCGSHGDRRLHLGRQPERRTRSDGGNPEQGGTARGTSETLPSRQSGGDTGAGGSAQLHRRLRRNRNGGNGAARASRRADVAMKASAPWATTAP